MTTENSKKTLLDAIVQPQARIAELEAESGDITGKSGLLPESGWDALPQILNERDDNARPLLNDIGQCIGYGRSCQILGELWDDHLQSAGFPRGRGRMENRPDVEYAEQQKQRAERAEADLAAARAERDVAVQTVGKVQSERDNALSDLAAARADAVRYRKLRSSAYKIYLFHNGEHYTVELPSPGYFPPSEFDAAIDAALAGKDAP